MEIFECKSGFDHKMKQGYEVYLQAPIITTKTLNKPNELLENKWQVFVAYTLIAPPRYRHFTFLEFVYWCGKDEVFVTRFITDFRPIKND